MATSNSTNFEPNVTEFIEEAFERCGLELRTGYDLVTAKRSINIMLAEWANRGLNQWTIEQTTQTLTEGTSSYSLNTNVIDILDMVVRRTTNNVDNDINISRISRSEYLNIPTKTTKGRPSLFFFDKTITPAINTMDMPFRFYPCFAAGLAYYLSVKRAPEKTQLLKGMYEEEFQRAADQDEDRASFRLKPSMRSSY